MFPTKIRGLAVGLTIFSARVINGLAPVVGIISDSTELHPLFISTLPCFLGIIACYMLPETLNKNLRN